MTEFIRNSTKLLFNPIFFLRALRKQIGIFLEAIILRLPTAFTSGLFSAAPAAAFSLYTLISSWDEYYWPTYAMMAILYLGISVVFGWILPIAVQSSKFNFPWLWLLLSGFLAWMVTLIGFGLLNLTPLCVGQDNGDGINNFALCSLYTIIIALVYSPGMLFLIALNAIICGKIIQHLAISQKSTESRLKKLI